MILWAALLLAGSAAAEPPDDGKEPPVGSVAELSKLLGEEFDILLALARRAGRVVPREALLDEAGRGDVSVSERTVDVHISHLRQKLRDDPRSPRRIKTVRGIGYVLAKDES